MRLYIVGNEMRRPLASFTNVGSHRSFLLVQKGTQYVPRILESCDDRRHRCWVLQDGCERMDLQMTMFVHVSDHFSIVGKDHLRLIGEVDLYDTIT